MSLMSVRSKSHPDPVICSALLTFVEHTILSEEPLGDDLGLRDGTEVRRGGGREGFEGVSSLS